MRRIVSDEAIPNTVDRGLLRPDGLAMTVEGYFWDRMLITPYFLLLTP